MFRPIIAGVSALAIATSVAHAGKDKDKAEAKEAEAAAIEASAETLTQPAKIIDAAQVLTRDDAKALAEAEFTQADLDANGKVSKIEFVAYASAKVTSTVHAEGDTDGVSTPILASVTPIEADEKSEKAAKAEGKKAKKAKKDAETAAAEVIGEGDAEIETAKGEVEGDAAYDVAEAKTDEKAEEKALTTEEQFAELSKGDEELTKEELIESRIAVFDAADANNDETLDDEERAHFAKLVAVAAPADNL